MPSVWFADDPDPHDAGGSRRAIETDRTGDQGGVPQRVPRQAERRVSNHALSFGTTARDGTTRAWGPGPTLTVVTGDEVRGASFREALWGYRPKDVDRTLAEVADALDARLSTAAVLAKIEFHKGLRGYNTNDVDRLLDRLRAG